MYSEVKSNSFGFYELIDKPSEKELDDYCSKHYYQDTMGAYSAQYSSTEVTYLYNKIAQKYGVLQEFMDINANQQPSLLDVGCGEGWALKFFKNQGWTVTGLDYSSYGCKKQNPDCLGYLLEGDIYCTLEELIGRGNLFDCIWLSNVLEHVREPQKLLLNCNSLIRDNGIMVVVVPNDFSVLQKHLFESGYIPANYWVTRPDHISYFNLSGLISEKISYSQPQ